MEEIQSAPPPLRVSVLIISRNTAKLLRKSLRALGASTPSSVLEVVVVDCGSQDEGPSMDTEFPAITMLRLPRNFGLTKARNIGIRTAKAGAILLMDPGVELSPNSVIRLADTLEASPDVMAVCPLLTGEGGKPLPQLRRLPQPVDLYEAWRNESAVPASVPEGASGLIPVEYPTCQAILVRRQAILGMNYFDERYGDFWGEAELCWQIRRASKKIVVDTSVQASLAGVVAAWGGTDRARAILSADCATGAAAYAGKHFGWAAGLGLKLRMILAALGDALGSLLTFRRTGYYFGRLSGVVAGQKVDGSQQDI